MDRVASLVIALLVCVSLGCSKGTVVPPRQGDGPRPMRVDDLDPDLDGEELTVRFTVAKLDGVSQLLKEGQGPTFVIEAAPGERGDRLTVWVEGELATVLDRLRMSFGQENEPKAGTTIVATGVLCFFEPHRYTLSVTRWQNFRVLPSNEKQ